jgi:hypothetical protein
MTAHAGSMNREKTIACALALLATTVACSPAMYAEEKIALCHAGLIKLASFAEHLKLLRRFK